MKKLLTRLAIVGGAAALVIAATGAFFSDIETSTGNTLVAGAFDLKIDNTCYYNGQACINGFWDGLDKEGNECSCTWKLKDLERGDVFFNLHDLKPGDWEEDTISLHIFDNDGWACVDLDLTQNIDNGCTEPESEDGDPECPTPNIPGGVGELAEELNFIFWADDGDNILEEGEEILTEGPASDVLGGVRWTIADALNNPFEREGPLIGSNTYFIGKAFCYGELTSDPLVQDGEDTGTPANDNDEDGDIDSEDGGFLCDGSQVNNISQTDLLAGDVVFEAVQSRHNEDFLCNPLPTPTPSPTELPRPLPTD